MCNSEDRLREKSGPLEDRMTGCGEAFIASGDLFLQNAACNSSKSRALGSELASAEVTVLGLDPSLTSTGLVVIDQAGRILHHQSITSTLGSSISFRLLGIARKVCQVAEAFQPAVTVLEGLAMGGVRGGAYLDLAGLHHHLRCALLERLPAIGARVKVVPPASLKKFLGRGNMRKDEVRLAVYKRWGVEFPTSDETDAYALAQWGLAYLRGKHQGGDK